MPISPTPPSGATRVSFFEEIIAAMGAPRGRGRGQPAHPFLRRRLQGPREHLSRGGSISIPPFVTPAEAGRRRRSPGTPPPVRVSGSLARIGRPRPAARASQSARIAPEAAAAIPLTKAHRHRTRERLQQNVGRDRRPQLAARSVAGFRARRMMQAVHPDADRRGDRIALPFDQDACELAAGAQEIVRPLERERRGDAGSERRAGVVNGQTGDKGELRRHGSRRRIDQQQARIEVAGRETRPGPGGRGPRSATPPRSTAAPHPAGAGALPQRLRIREIDGFGGRRWACRLLWYDAARCHAPRKRGTNPLAQSLELMRLNRESGVTHAVTGRRPPRGVAGG